MKYIYNETFRIYGIFVSVNNMFQTKKNLIQIQGVSAKTFEPNIWVLCQRIFMKFKMQIFQTVKVQLVTIKLPQVKKCDFNTCFLYRKLCAIIIRLLNIKKYTKNTIHKQLSKSLI
jgi:hypothetical protein